MLQSCLNAGKEGGSVNPGAFAAGVFVAVLLGAVIYRSKTTHFKCPTCGCVFRLSSVSYVLALHILNKRYAACPNCGHSGMMTVVKNK